MCVCCVCIYVVVTLRFATTTYIDTHIHTYNTCIHTYISGANPIWIHHWVLLLLLKLLVVVLLLFELLLLLAGGALV